MRIIAKNHDYYDCIQRSGQDQSVVYLRKPRTVKIDTKNWPFPTLMSYDVDGLIIGFCGKIYPIVTVRSWNVYENNRHKTCYTMEEVDTFFEKNLKKRKLKIYHGAFSRDYYAVRRAPIAKFFKECAEVQDKFLEMFIENKSPLFVAHWGRRSWESRIEFDAELKPFEFYRIFEPYAAFQEIAMFLSNIAVPQKPMPEISDEMKAGSKGFDKWSFRNPPYRLK